jgi:hypothetical protein
MRFKMKKKAVPVVSLMIMLVNPSVAMVVCPICTVAAAGGLGISRYLGVDDFITGIWIGGLIVSSGLWLADWLTKRFRKFIGAEILSVTLFFAIVVPPLYWADLIGLPDNALLGVDKVLLGTITGMFVFILGVALDRFLRNKNDQKVFIYYQKVILPIFLLTILSYVYYLYS